MTLPLSEKPWSVNMASRKPDAASVLVDALPPLGKTHMHRVQMRLLEVPELYLAEMRRETRGARGILAFRPWRRRERRCGIEGVGEFNESIGEDGRSTGWYRFSDDLVAVAQLCLERDGAGCREIAGEKAFDVERRIAARGHLWAGRRCCQYRPGERCEERLHDRFRRMSSSRFRSRRAECLCVRSSPTCTVKTFSF